MKREQVIFMARIIDETRIRTEKDAGQPGEGGASRCSDIQDFPWEVWVLEVCRGGQKQSLYDSVHLLMTASRLHFEKMRR